MTLKAPTARKCDSLGQRPRKLIVDLQALKARHEDAHKEFRFFRALSLIVALPGALPRLSHFAPSALSS